MVKLRLKRFGKKFQPTYRVVAIQARTKRQGAALEDLGHYSPMTKEITLNKERIEYWLKNGAQPTDTVSTLLIREKVIDAPKTKKKFNVAPGRKSEERKAKKEEAKAQASASAEAETVTDEPAAE